MFSRRVAFCVSRRGHDCKGDYLIRIIMLNRDQSCKDAHSVKCEIAALRLNLQKWSSYGSSCAMLRSQLQERFFLRRI